LNESINLKSLERSLQRKFFDCVFLIDIIDYDIPTFSFFDSTYNEIQIMKSQLCERIKCEKLTPDLDEKCKNMKNRDDINDIFSQIVACSRIVLTLGYTTPSTKISD